MYAAPYWVVYKVHQAAIDARRRSRTGMYLAWSAAAGALAAIMIAFGVSMFLMFWIVGLWWAALPLGGVMILPVVAPLVVRHILVPLGWCRPAYWAARFSRPGADAPAYGLAAAGWSFAHDPSPTAEVWLAARREARIPMGDAEVVMTAFVAAGRGDADTARLLLRSVAMLVENHPSVRELAGEWLAVDAAERGAWRELHETAQRLHWPATPLTFFLEGIAARHVGDPDAPARSSLIARWLLAPHRRATRALLAIEPAPVSAAPAPIALGDTTPSTDIVEAPSPLPRAVATHLAFGNGEPPTPARLAQTVKAWDAALADGNTHGWLARRALELDAPLGAVDRALREIAGTVTEELARAADQARLGAPSSHGPVGDALARKLRHGRLDGPRARLHALVESSSRRCVALRDRRVARVRGAACRVHRCRAGRGHRAAPPRIPTRLLDRQQHGRVVVEHAPRVRAVARDLEVAPRGGDGRRRCRSDRARSSQLPARRADAPGIDSRRSCDVTGPRLLALITLAVAAMLAVILLTSDGGLVDTASTVTRWTARSSLIVFTLAYVARPAVHLYRNAFTKRLLAERKWIGLGYAVSHLAHLGGILTVAAQDWGLFLRSQSIATLTGTFTFVLLFAMAFTSIEAVKKRMSARAWKLLHRTGMHFSWIAFTGTYALAITKSPAYALPTAILLAAGTLRLLAWVRLRRRHEAAA